MNRSYLAFDLGAESGRAILGTLDDEGRLSLKELRRFPNGPRDSGGRLRWDARRLLSEVREGLKAAAGGPPLDGIGVDTWGVDFGLLDAEGELLEDPLAYRDSAFPPAMHDFLRGFPPERLHTLTGIQFLPLNTLFQLHALALEKSRALKDADSLLFMPDLFNFQLAGLRRSEATIASTSQLVDARTGGWQEEVLASLGAPRKLFQELVPPGTVLGPLCGRARELSGLGLVPVIAVASHDTASAVAAVPASGPGFAYLSSGTWSLAGIEAESPVISEASLKRNVTNERGLGGSYRVLKNLMGLWLLQECRREWSGSRDWPYSELTALAERAEPFRSLIDPERPEFFPPGDMPSRIRAFLARTGQPALKDEGETARCVFESLALSCRSALQDIRDAAGVSIDRIHVIGGGSRNELLCRMTAGATGLPVIAGPAEATAVGNLLVQALATGRLGSREEIREVVRRSFQLTTYEPSDAGAWGDACGRFRHIRDRAD